MKNIDIEKVKEVYNNTWRSYTEMQSNLPWFEDFRQEVETLKGYRGREILELLQNADDAGSPKACISLNTHSNTITITNFGEGTIPFSFEGFRAVMLSNLSPKESNGEERLIGAKGLGFKSVLNWAEKIELQSNNIKLTFGTEQAMFKWKELKKRLYIQQETIKDQEEMAAQQGRCVPISILRLPDIEEVEADDDRTSIVLHYKPETQSLIDSQLRKFTPESLLFLHHLKELEIIIDDKRAYYTLSGKSEEKGISTASLSVESEIEGISANESQWALAHDFGRECGKRYEAAAAINIFMRNIAEQSHFLYCFFPTKVKIGMPCILHATLELDATRNALIEASELNDRMMDKLAGCIEILCEYLKQNENHIDWAPYLMMHPQSFDENYLKILKNNLSRRASGKKLIPTIGGEYCSEEETYYYTNQIFKAVRVRGKDLFAKMRLDGAPTSLVWREDPDMKSHVEDYCNNVLKEDYDALADFICMLLEYHKIHLVAEKYEILPDPDGNIIHQNVGSKPSDEILAHVNTGERIDNIPSFRRLRYVSPKLIACLVERLELKGDLRNREVANRLSAITIVTSTDITGVTRLLIPKESDKNLSDDNKQELMISLFRLFMSRMQSTKDGFVISKDVSPYILSENGEWKRASELVMSDRRFPDGFRNIIDNDTYYASEQCAAYPAYLEGLDLSNSKSENECDNSDKRISTPSNVQSFLKALGANLYFLRKEESITNGLKYAEYLFHKKEIDVYARDRCVGKKIIPDINALRKLSLQSLLILLEKSDFADKIINGEKFQWFYNGTKEKEVSLSYVAFKIRTDTDAGMLKNYSIEEDFWLPGYKNKHVLKIDTSDYRTRALLHKLGAKRRMADFDAEELYLALNQIGENWKQTQSTNGVKNMYHEIKQALDQRVDARPIPDSCQLNLLCTINGECRLMPSRDIFYSDNKSLPKAVMDKLPLLLANNREGEGKISQYFGCRTLKDLSTRVLEEEINVNLDRQLGAHLEKIKPYLLAYAVEKAGSLGGNREASVNPQQKALETLSITPVKSLSYRYEIEMNDMRQYDNGIKLNENEMLYHRDASTSQKKRLDNIYLKSVCESLEEALINPRFVNALVEAVCISLRLSMDENIHKFYRIIKATDRELEYLRTSEIDPELWQGCIAAFGASKEEIDFWEEVCRKNGKKFNCCHDDNLDRNMLAEILGIERSIATKEAFEANQKRLLKAQRDKLTAGYCWHIHSLSLGNAEKERCYLARKSDFEKDDWVENLQKGISHKLAPDYANIIAKECRDRFDFIQDADSNDNYPDILDDYKKLISECNSSLSLSEAQRSMLYFPGHVKELESWLQDISKANEEKEEADSNRLIGSSILPIEEVSIELVDNTSIHDGKNYGGGGGGGCSSNDDKVKKRHGNWAEDKVVEAMEKDPRYKIIRKWSKYLDKLNGSDEVGYDLSYELTSRPGETRMLEIKYSDGKSFIMSANEFNVGCKNPLYDFALVSPKEIKIIQGALTDDSRYRATAHSYNVKVLTTTKTDVCFSDTDSNEHIQ